MKKRIALLAATTLVMSSLSGCASNSTAPETTAAATTQAEKETTASDTQATSTGDTGEWSKTITLADGKTYPSGTVTIIAPFSAGGGVDLGDRLFAKYAQKWTDATLIVENITGGSGLVGIQTGLGRATDGSVMWHIDPGAQYVSTTNSSCPFDVVNDMGHIGFFVADDRVWAVKPDETRFTTAEEMFAYAKDHPGEISIAASGTGTIAALATQYIANTAGVEFNIIGYNGSSEAKAAFLGGHCDVMSAGVSEARTMLDENQCKVLFTMTDERIYDDIPTVKELGYDCTSLSTYRGLAMSSKVDPAIVEYWDKIMEKVCEDPDFIAEADNMGLVIRFHNTDEALKIFREYNPIWYDLKESLGM